MRARHCWRACLSLVACLIACRAAGAQPLRPDVAFRGAGGMQLRGTLVVPEGPDGQRVAAVLLLPGSGPTDRDGNQRPLLVTDLLRQISERLNKEGIATFRFDKRAVHAYGAEWPGKVEDFNDFFSFENFVTDAGAAYKFLRSFPGVDPARVFILGHSEGGLIALQIAADKAQSDDRPAGLILLGTAGRVGDVVIREQIDAALKPPAADESTRAEYLSQLDGAIKALKAGQPLPKDIPPGLSAVLNPTCQKLLRSYFTIDPAVLAAKARGPVLIIQGEKDAQVAAEKDTPLLEKALRSRAADGGAAGVQVLVVPGASHNLKKKTDEQDPGFAGPVAPEALDRLADWFRERTKGPTQ